MATVMSELLPEVDKFLSKSLQRPLVGGKEIEASDGSTFETHDPGSGEVLATVPNLTAKDVDAAVAAAQKAFDKSGWATLPPNERGVMLHRLADAIEKRNPIIGQIESLDAGKLEAHAKATSPTSSPRFVTSPTCPTHRPPQCARGHRPRSLDGAPALGPLRFHLPLELPVHADRLGHLAGARRR